MVLLGILAVTAIAVLVTRHLFVATMLAGSYSLTSAALLVNLDAVDVAFTEAAVGAGVSSVLMLATLALTRRSEKVPSRRPGFGPLLLVLATGALLIYGTLDMPAFGDPNAPAMLPIAPESLAGARDHIRTPTILAAILARSSGHETLCETAGGRPEGRRGG